MDGWGRVAAWGSAAFEEKLDCCGGPKGICGVNVRGQGVIIHFMQFNLFELIYSREKTPLEPVFVKALVCHWIFVLLCVILTL